EDLLGDPVVVSKPWESEVLDCFGLDGDELRVHLVYIGGWAPSPIWSRLWQPTDVPVLLQHVQGGLHSTDWLEQLSAFERFVGFMNALLSHTIVSEPCGEGASEV